MSSVNATVRTRSLRGGHFRAGRKHEETGTDFPPGTFTEEQLDQLQADPDLEVVLVEPPRKKQPLEPETDGTEPAEGEDFEFDADGASQDGQGDADATVDDGGKDDAAPDDVLPQNDTPEEGDTDEPEADKPKAKPAAKKAAS